MIIQYFKTHEWAMTTLSVILILGITYLVSTALRLLWKRKMKGGTSLFRKFLHNFVQMLIYLFGILFAIGRIPSLSNVSKTLLAGSGVIALAVSLSAQESFSNIISGFFITIFKPFEIGDRVTLINSGITGTIEDITLRHTIVKTFVNTRIVVPNSSMNKEIIENSQLIDKNASAFLDVTVAYESDIDKAMSIMADVIGNHPLYHDVRTKEQKKKVPKVKVFVRNLGHSGIELRANVWTKTVDTNFEACSDIRLAIKKAFDEAGIEIPYTKYTILQQQKKKV